jgi:multidrug efflux pump subunit AcrB
VKYTRYNYKPPRKKNNFIIVFILILIAALALGTIFSKLLPKNNNPKATSTEDITKKTDLEKPREASKDTADGAKVVSQTGIKDYVALQCGAFSDKEKALLLKNSLIKFGTPFIIEEDKLNRVLFGIYPKDSIDAITKQLKDNKIEYLKINFALASKDSTGSQTNEMVSALVEILNKLSEKDTKYVETVELKKWLVSLEGIDEKSENYNSMKEIKTYLTALPEQIKTEKTEEGYVYIYKFIKKLVKA